MILVRLMGGLGNQMFQYAFGKSLALKNEVELKLDVSLLGSETSVENPVIRNYDLDLFDLKESFATQEEIINFNGKTNPGLLDRIIFKSNQKLGKYPLVIQHEHDFDLHQINAIGKNACIVGRWQSEDFFKGFEAAIKKIVTLDSFKPNSYSEKVAEVMANSLSVAVHVRRGDYVLHPEYSKGIGALSKQYYLDAIAQMNQKLTAIGSAKYFFISDDMEWCKQHFSSIAGAVFVEQEKSKIGYQSDFWLLTKCKYNIISNSTFSWWGAWLGEKSDSIIIAPKIWAKETRYLPIQIVPERWLKLDNDFCLD